MYLAEGLQKKWAPVLDHEDMPKIKDPYRKAVTAVLLENQEKSMAEQGGQYLSEAAPVNKSSAAALAVTRIASPVAALWQVFHSCVNEVNDDDYKTRF